MLLPLPWRGDRPADQAAQRERLRSVSDRKDVEAVTAAARVVDVTLNEQRVSARKQRERSLVAACAVGEKNIPVRVHQPPISVGQAGEAQIIEKEFAAGGEVELISNGGVGGIQGAVNRRAGRKRRGARHVKQTELVTTGVVAAAEDGERVVACGQGKQRIAAPQAIRGAEVPIVHDVARRAVE